MFLRARLPRFSKVAGRRQGRGRYVWNESDWYEGPYEDNFPHGSGTAHIAGVTFAGQWKHGCLKQGAKMVAIGVSRKSCEESEQQMAAELCALIRDLSEQPIAADREATTG